MKVTDRRIFQYPQAVVARYYFDNGYELDQYNSGRVYGRTPTYKFAAPRVVSKMIKAVCKFEHNN